MPSTSLCAFLYAGTWIVLIIGWIIVDYQNNQRETRKEIRARIDQIHTWINEIVTLATSYHTSTRDESVERKLKSQIGRTTNAISSLNMFVNPKLPHQAYLFRNSITLKNFDTPNHKAISIHDEIVDSIAESSQDLINLLEILYSDKYH